MSKASYVCQRAAHTILSETNTRYISTDGLQAINTFIDEFLFIILSDTHASDLHIIKSSVQKHLPNSLGKNAILEADAELKDLLDISFDFSVYNTNKKKPPNIQKLQYACADHCTLSDNKSETSDVLVIYLTAIVEHITEYLLISLSNQTDSDLVRVKEILMGLVNDSKLNHLFQKMYLKEQLQKKFSIYFNTPTASLYSEPKFDSGLSVNSSRKSTESDSSSKSSKRRFSFFGNKKRHSVQTSFSQSQQNSPLATDFEDLFQSGQTKKVSLTPNRLKTIEITPHTAPQEIPPTSSPKSSTLSSRLSQKYHTILEKKESNLFEKPQEGPLKKNNTETATKEPKEKIIIKPSESAIKRNSARRPISYHEPHIFLKPKTKITQTIIKNQSLADWNQEKEKLFTQWLENSH